MRQQELHPRTAVINKTQQNKSKLARIQALSWLAVHFPAAFDITLHVRPLKVGIMEDIFLHSDEAEKVGVSKSKLREAVVLFTRRLDYLTCLKQREWRVDLQGNEVTQVSEDEAECAAAKIKKRIEKNVRSTRKVLTEKTTSPASFNQKSSAYQSKITQTSAAVTEDYFPTYPTRSTPYSSSYSATNSSKQPVRSSVVVVKNKTERQFDPSALARLKEKLGLSRSSEDKKEVIE